MKKGIYKRILSCILSLAMIISLISVSTMQAYASMMIPVDINENGELDEGEETIDINEGEEAIDLNEENGVDNSTIKESDIDDLTFEETGKEEEEPDNSIAFTGLADKGFASESGDITSLPVIEVVTGSPARIIANGNAIILKAGSNADYTNLYIDANGNNVADEDEIVDLKDAVYFGDELPGDTEDGFDLSQVIIFGARKATSYTGDTSITMLSGKVNSIFGGGYSVGMNYADMTGNTYITVNGGSVSSVYGGGDRDRVNGDTYITLNAGNIGFVSGGCSHGNVVGNSNITVNGATAKTIYGSVMGFGSVITSNITINSGTITGSIYGGGSVPSNKTINISTNIKISGGNFSNGSVYGGGSNSSETELTSTNITISGGNFTNYNIYGGGSNGEVGTSENNVKCNIILHGGTFNNVYIYGGGSNKQVYGDTQITIGNGVNLNQTVVYGGGYHTSFSSSQGSDVSGNTSIIINGGNITSVYGGGRYDAGPSAKVQGKASITVNEGTINNIYLGGNHENSSANTASIIVNSGTITNVHKGYVSGDATLTYSGGTITGVVDTGLCKDVAFTGLTANGVYADETTTQLTLNFSDDLISLNVSHITVTGATKGALNGSGTTRTLDISNITVENGEEITVTITSPTAFAITPASRTVAVYKELPKISVQKGSPKQIFANGNAIILKEGSGWRRINLYIDTNGNGAIDAGEIPINLNAPEYFNNTLDGSTSMGFDLSSVDIYGGGYGTPFTGDTKITMLSGQVRTIYGGGLGTFTQDATVTGNTYINVVGGSALGICGGGDRFAEIVGNINITLNGGNLTSGVFCGGQGSPVTGNINLTINGGVVGTFGSSGYGFIYGGGTGESASIQGDAHITVNSGATLNNMNVYGGGMNASIQGNTYITVNHGATLNNVNVYGGGHVNTNSRQGDVTGNTSIVIHGGSFDTIYGGGNSTTSTSSVTVNEASITVNGGTVKNLYLGGNDISSAASARASASITAGTITNIYKGNVSGTATLNYTGGTISGVVDASLCKDVTFTGLTANGVSVDETTTQLTLTFSEDPISLNASHITVTGATKGTLSGSGTTRTLDISDITVKNGQNIVVTIVAPPAYKITPDSKQVTVYKLFTPTLTDITLTPVRVNYADRATAGTKIADLEVTGTPITGISYILEGSDDDNLFQISENELQLKSGTTLVDGQEYTVTVKVSEVAEELNTYSEKITFKPIIPPTVTSITRLTPAEGITKVDTVTFRVTFSENVIGVDTGDFALTKTGSVMGSISSVSAESGSVIDVSVDSITGAGNLRLDLKSAGTGISDSEGNEIGEGFTGGESYQVDRTAPTLIAGPVTRTSDTNATVKFNSDEVGTYYYEVVASGEASPTIDTSGVGVDCSLGQNTITLTSLSAGAKEIYIVVKDALDNVSTSTFKISIPAYVVPPNNNDGNNGGSSGGSGGSSDGGSSIIGNIIKEQQQEKGAPASSLNNDTEDLKTSVFNANELSRIAVGETAKVILKVTSVNDSVSEEEKKKIREKLEAEQQAIEEGSLLYVDISLYKQIGQGQESKVTQTSGKISISIEIPESMRNTTEGVDRIYRVIRIHNGEAEILEGTYDPSTHLFTFETDRFSTYVLTYQDKKTDMDSEDDTAADQLKVYNDFHHLRLKVKSSRSSQKLSYQEISGAQGYLIYGAKCGQPLKELVDVEKDVTSYTVKNLKKGTNYKYQVKAYRIIDGEKVIIATSKVVHGITKHKSYADPVKVTTKVEAVKLSVGKNKTVTCQVVLPEGKKLKEHTAILRYESSNKSIATVNSSG
jgi:hypothetical protein